MKILAQCPHCREVVEVSADALSARVRCRGCRLRFQLPDSDELHDAIELMANSTGSVLIDRHGNVYA